MRLNIAAALVLAGTVVLSASAQDLGAAAENWYHDRVTRFSGQQGHDQLFTQVRADLDHIGSARNAAEKENQRLEKTKEELGKMQADLDQNRYDNGILNDVMDSLKKSADDQRLAPRDRAVISDDLNRLHEYQQNPRAWKK